MNRRRLHLGLPGPTRLIMAAGLTKRRPLARPGVRRHLWLLSSSSFLPARPQERDSAHLPLSTAPHPHAPHVTQRPSTSRSQNIHRTCSHTRSHCRPPAMFTTTETYVDQAPFPLPTLPGAPGPRPLDHPPSCESTISTLSSDPLAPTGQPAPRSQEGRSGETDPPVAAPALRGRSKAASQREAHCAALAASQHPDPAPWRMRSSEIPPSPSPTPKRSLRSSLPWTLTLRKKERGKPGKGTCFCQ